MCTAATYQTKDFYFGRNLDYEFGYGETVTFTPRHYPFQLNGLGVLEEVMPLSARMVVNQVSMKMESERITKLIQDLRAAL